MEREMVRCCFFVLLTTTLLSGRVEAQPEQRRATIAGQVLGPDSVPLVGVDVTIVGSRERKLTDHTGRVRFTGIYPGRYELFFRRIGYEQLTRFVTVGSGEENVRTFGMRRLPEVLQTVTIAGKRYDVPPRYQDVYRRAAIGFGTVIFADEIARRMPMDVKAMLQGMPGVRVYYGRQDVVLEIEVYRGVAQIPAEFLADACAVIAIWTKSY